MRRLSRPSAAALVPPVPSLLSALAVLPVLATALFGSPAAAATAPVGGPLLGGAGVIVSAPAGVPKPPKVDAAAYVVADGTTGTILAAKAPHQRLRPASTQKTLLAVTLMDKLPADATYTAVWDDANVEGSRVGIVANGVYTTRNLWEALFLRSGNDAANALANLNGGVALTVAQMNGTAKDLQANDTHAVNPSGLDADGQYSSAYDLALFGRAALRNPAILQYTGMIKSQFPGKMPKAGKKRTTFEIYTEQKFVLHYDGAIGIKNGWTTKARNTLIVAARRGDRTILVTLMKANYQAWKQAAALADWGFRTAARTTPVGQLVEPLSTLPKPIDTPSASRGTPTAAQARVAPASRAGGGIGTGALASGAAAAVIVGGIALRGRARARSRRRTGPALRY